MHGGVCVLHSQEVSDTVTSAYTGQPGVRGRSDVPV
jgi:hypothetical protein